MARMALNDAEVALPGLSHAPVFTILQRLSASPRGLTELEAAERARRFGPNDPPGRDVDRFGLRIRRALRSPFVLLLTLLGVVFAAVGDLDGAITVLFMVGAAILLRIWQETRSAKAAARLQRYVTTTATVRRRADDGSPSRQREVPVEELVPGDVVELRPGDWVPADVRLLSSTDLVVDQSVLTGESLPVPKFAVQSGIEAVESDAVTGLPSLCYSGTAVVSGTAAALVLSTGDSTHFGALARAARRRRPPSSFDRGVRSVGWTLVRFMLTLTPIVFVCNGSVSGNWAQAGMFALAVAVGLTPEMLPVIVTTNLARSAIQLAHRKVVVRRLDAIQDLGAMDILCLDKTGTVTEGRIVFGHAVDVCGSNDPTVAELASAAVYFQDGPLNALDEAIMEMVAEPDHALFAEATMDKVDQIGFDILRRRTTVVVTRRRGHHMLICKGDPAQVLSRCTGARVADAVLAFDSESTGGLADRIDDILGDLHRRGMRVLAVAVRETTARIEPYTEADERDLVLVGFVAFIDPIRLSAPDAVALLADHGVGVTMLTGDSSAVARYAAERIGLGADRPVRGRELDGCTEAELCSLVTRYRVFAELSPAHKSRLVSALRSAGHVVGFLGDGVNDVAALRVADAGIAADTATDVAKGAADLILLDRDLAVIASGVVEGRRTLANTMKYVKITASSNFGNVLSVLVASVVLPFLPMLPIQLMLQNLLYDSAQLALPWDRVDPGYLRNPHGWDARGLVGFMVLFGAVSSVFDLATFGALWWLFGGDQSPAVFHTGWFVEGLLTQLLAVLVLRSPTLPWREARPSTALLCATTLCAGLGVLLAVSPAARLFHMTSPPAPYWLWLLVVSGSYASAVELVKRRYVNRYVNSVAGQRGGDNTDSRPH
ncbi:magnesium-translocating P-type ATPase [Mycobacterium sp. DL592]|uniref:magnesium-translocating P-type ATPase n=1 Tax=Mycobacterium sp. DL592 TaxID=2675524 RepID=UPI00141DCC94|nr:magnesium-translocating P-type ATPase [Mycobacterium sp. DL592]